MSYSHACMLSQHIRPSISGISATRLHLQTAVTRFLVHCQLKFALKSLYEYVRLQVKLQRRRQPATHTFSQLTQKLSSPTSSHLLCQKYSVKCHGRSPSQLVLVSFLLFRMTWTTYLLRK